MHDVTVKIDDKTTIKGEFAASERSRAGVDTDGDAWKLEALREDKDLSAKAYARRQEPGFGLGQQAGAETGTQKFGGDARYKVTDDVQVDGQLYRQDTLSNGAQRDVAEGQVQWRKDALTTTGGLRSVHDKDGRARTPKAIRRWRALRTSCSIAGCGCGPTPKWTSPARQKASTSRTGFCWGPSTS